MEMYKTDGNFPTCKSQEIWVTINENCYLDSGEGQQMNGAGLE